MCGGEKKVQTVASVAINDSDEAHKVDSAQVEIMLLPVGSYVAKASDQGTLNFNTA